MIWWSNSRKQEVPSLFYERGGGGSMRQFIQCFFMSPHSFNQVYLPSLPLLVKKETFHFCIRTRGSTQIVNSYITENIIGHRFLDLSVRVGGEVGRREGAPQSLFLTCYR